MTEPSTQSTTDLIRSEIEHLLNLHSREDKSNTPDYILADVMMAALIAFEGASRRREEWYGKALSINADESPWVIP